MTIATHGRHVTGFNLRALIRDVCDTSDTASPNELAAEVLAQIDPGDQLDALRQALPALVGAVVSADRRRILPSEAGTDTTPDPGAPGPSWKVAALRDHWRTHLRDRIRIGEHQWALLGECTAEHLTFAADHRDDLARRNAAAADRFRDLAKALIEHAAGTVADLPDAVLAAHLASERVA